MGDSVYSVAIGGNILPQRLVAQVTLPNWPVRVPINVHHHRAYFAAPFVSAGFWSTIGNRCAHANRVPCLDGKPAIRQIPRCLGTISQYCSQILSDCCSDFWCHATKVDSLDMHVNRITNIRPREKIGEVEANTCLEDLWIWLGRHQPSVQLASKG